SQLGRGVVVYSTTHNIFSEMHSVKDHYKGQWCLTNKRKALGRLFEEVNRFRFDQQPRFKRPKFDDRIIVVKEEVVRTGEPDFTCHYLVDSLILVIEAKRKHVLEDMGEQTFPDYGILATYDNHWFLRREHTELWISKTLPLQSESPPVLKAYAYLTRQTKENTKSSHPQVLVSVHGDNNSRTLRLHMKSPSSSSLNPINN
ncbi:14951_t:CDS:2, partial [Funneliformis geosporum]